MRNNNIKLENVSSFQTNRLFIIFSLVVFNLSVFGQKLVDLNETIISSKYGYSITVPKSFTKGSPIQKNTDLVFDDSYGSSIHSPPRLQRGVNGKAFVTLKMIYFKGKHSPPRL
jgi:hypothetical protein